MIRDREQPECGFREMLPGPDGRQGEPTSGDDGWSPGRWRSLDGGRSRGAGGGPERTPDRIRGSRLSASCLLQVDERAGPKIRWGLVIRQGVSAPSSLNCTDQERHLPCRFSLLPFTLCSHILPTTSQVGWTPQEALPEDMGTVEFQGHTHTPAQQEAVVM